MSGICGFIQLDGAPADPADLARMTRLLERRGPDGTGRWHEGSVALGHTLLATTPESLHETLPLRHPETGCVITADVRLDNRPELLEALGARQRLGEAGDGRLLLEAYLRWGDACVDHLLGDFAFAIWDPRVRRLFCARDHMGMRQLIYHHTPGRLFAFATEPRAVLAHPQTPYRINEARITDFLLNFEAFDKTSTFFEDLFRLPPGHSLEYEDGLHSGQYWCLAPQPELKLRSNEEYAEAFLEVFTEAVRCRLRAPPGKVGSMLSGGMDSGSIVAVAREIMAAEARGPLPTFSAVGPDPNTCRETRTILAVMKMAGIEPHVVDYTALGDLLPALTDLRSKVDEPFDSHMNLMRALYLAAHRRGLKVLLDGGSGDTVVDEASHFVRLIRKGQWICAYRQAIGQERFWGADYPAWPKLLRGIWQGLAPNVLREMRSRLMQPRGGMLNGLPPLNSAFADRVQLGRRIADYHARGTSDCRPYSEERRDGVTSPFLTAGRERYDRVAAALGIEPRDPFLDRRVVVYALGLPGDQLLADGWQKQILRRAMNGRLPDVVRWRLGKEHLGPSFTSAVPVSRLRQPVKETRVTPRPLPLDDSAFQESTYVVLDNRDQNLNRDAASTVVDLGCWLDNQWTFVNSHRHTQLVKERVNA